MVGSASYPLQLFFLIYLKWGLHTVPPPPSLFKTTGERLILSYGSPSLERYLQSIIIKGFTSILLPPPSILA